MTLPSGRVGDFGLPRDKWIADQLASAPPLTQAQQAELRRLLLPSSAARRSA